MAGKREQVFVGLFVIAASAVLIGMVFAISGAFGRTSKTYHTYVPFAGGLEQGSTVRYAGGPKVGRVEKLSIDPKDPSQIEIVFSVQTDLPVKTDSHVKIMSMSPLGDNHLEILPGGPQSPAARPGSVLTAEDYVDFNAVLAKVNSLAPKADKLVDALTDGAKDLKGTLDRVNGILSDENRDNLSAALADTRQLLDDNKESITSTIENVHASSKKLGPLMDEVHKATQQANTALAHLDEILGDNKDNLHDAIVQARKSLNNITDITTRIDQTLDVNTENIDELLDNFRRVSQNLKEFTETIKRRPYTLIRATNPTEHKPGEHQ